MKLIWENAYGREYSIRVSDDEQTWYQLRHVAGARGGSEEFMNLNANVRYIRIHIASRPMVSGPRLSRYRFESYGWRIETRCAARDPYLLKLW